MARKQTPEEIEQEHPRDADAVADANEDIPSIPPPKEGLPFTDREPVKHEKHKKDGVDKALEMLDDYMDGVPSRDPRFPHDDDHS